MIQCMFILVDHGHITLSSLQSMLMYPLLKFPCDLILVIAACNRNIGISHLMFRNIVSLIEVENKSYDLVFNGTSYRLK